MRRGRHVLIEPLLGDKEMDGKVKLFARVTLEPGCSLGYHEHHGNSETYYILTGSGRYNDNGCDAGRGARRRNLYPFGQRPRAGQHREKTIWNLWL